MGAKQAKLLHSRVGKKQIKCGECAQKCDKSTVSYCHSCSQMHPEAVLDTLPLCSKCAIVHDSSHLILNKTPSRAKIRQKVRRIEEEVNEMEMDVMGAIADIKEHLWRVEAVQKDRLKALKEMAESGRKELENCGKMCSKTRINLLETMEETKLRNRVLVQRLKILEENTEQLFTCNGTNLQYEGDGNVRDGLREEVVRQAKNGNHNAAVETFNELLDATTGRITLAEAEMSSRLIVDRIVQVGALYKAQQIRSDNLCSITTEIRCECSEMLDILTRIHSHADVSLHKHGARGIKNGVNPSLDYLFNLSPEDNLSLKYTRRRPDMQKFANTQIIMIRYFVAIHVCALWLHVSEDDKDEFSDVSQQLHDCVDGYIYAAKQQHWPPGHPIYTTLASLLMDLCRKYEEVRAIKHIRKSIQKVIVQASRSSQNGFGLREKTKGDEMIIALHQGYMELWGRG